MKIAVFHRTVDAPLRAVLRYQRWCPATSTARRTGRRTTRPGAGVGAAARTAPGVPRCSGIRYRSAAGVAGRSTRPCRGVTH